MFPGPRLLRCLPVALLEGNDGMSASNTYSIAAILRTLLPASCLLQNLPFEHCVGVLFCEQARSSPEASLSLRASKPQASSRNPKISACKLRQGETWRRISQGDTALLEPCRLSWGKLGHSCAEALLDSLTESPCTHARYGALSIL